VDNFDSSLLKEGLCPQSMLHLKQGLLLPVHIWRYCVCVYVYACACVHMDTCLFKELTVNQQHCMEEFYILIYYMNNVFIKRLDYECY
jgi:hypothetical protein